MDHRGVTGTPNPLRGNADLVDCLGSALRSGEHGLSTVPGLLKRVLAEGAWREFETLRGELIHHERFADFVTLAPLKGLGASVDLVRRVIEDDAEAVDLLDQALQGKSGTRTDLGNNVPEVARPEGNTKEKALRRLRKDAPELHADVLAGNLTAHAAMVKAGFRRPTATIPLDNPESVAETLRRRLDPETLAEVARLLNES